MIIPKTQKGKKPHYFAGLKLGKHPASGGAVPTVLAPAEECSDTGTIAPHAYKSRWGRRSANTALRVLLLGAESGEPTDTEEEDDNGLYV